jgi:dihydroorotate dehydrogenase electron transfer subunit
VSPDRVQAPFGRRTVGVSRRTEHGPYVVIRCPDPDGPRPQAGQFYMLAAAERWGGGEDERPFLSRAFSVLRAPAGADWLEFMLHDVGPGTRRLTELDEGDGLRLIGPLGIPFAPAREGRRPLLVGGGVGVAPLAILQDGLSEQTAGKPPPVTLLGFRDAHHAAGAELMTHVRLATEDGSAGHGGLVTDLLGEELHLDDHAEVFACGPPAMLEAVRMSCAEHRVPAQLALESEMACGFGACFGCVVHTRDGLIRLCVDGPVLDAARLDSVVGVGATRR